MTEVTASLLVNMNEGISSMTNDNLIDILEESIASHVNWTDTLGRIVQAGKMEPIQVDGTRCEFGHYYHSLKIEDPQIKDIWDSIDVLHLKMHEKAQEIEKAIESDQSGNVQSLYNDAKDYSKQMIQIFQEVIQEVNNLTKANQTVF